MSFLPLVILSRTISHTIMRGIVFSFLVMVKTIFDFLVMVKTMLSFLVMVKIMFSFLRCQWKQKQDQLGTDNN